MSNLTEVFIVYKNTRTGSEIGVWHYEKNTDGRDLKQEIEARIRPTLQRDIEIDVRTQRNVVIAPR